MRFTVKEPANVKLPPGFFLSLIFVSLPSLHSDYLRNSKGFSDQFLALFPECLGTIRIDRVCKYSLTEGADSRFIPDDLADLAVCTIPATDLVGRSNRSCPHRSRRSLRNCLPRKALS